MKEEELKLILEQHKLWLNSDGKEGRRADLSHVSEWSESGKTAYHNGKKVQIGLEAAVKIWPTPIATEWKNGCGKTGNRASEKSAKAGLKIGEAVKLWQNATDSKNSSFTTPQARDFRMGQKEHFQNPTRTKNLNDKIGGSLNPTWCEWLMGWPLGWTDLKPLETDKFQEWLRQHSLY